MKGENIRWDEILGCISILHRSLAKHLSSPPEKFASSRNVCDLIIVGKKVGLNIFANEREVAYLERPQ